MWICRLWPGPQQSGSIDLIESKDLRYQGNHQAQRRLGTRQSGEATGVLHVPRDGFWLELRSISVSRDLHRLCLLMGKLKPLVITCYNSHNHRNHQNRSSRHLRMFCPKKACPQPAQPESGGQSLIRRSTVRINSIQYCPTGNEMNAVLLEHLERKN